MATPFRISPKVWSAPDGERFMVLYAHGIADQPDLGLRVFVTNDRTYQHVHLSIADYNALPRLTLVEVGDA